MLTQTLDLLGKTSLRRSDEKYAMQLMQLLRPLLAEHERSAENAGTLSTIVSFFVYRLYTEGFRQGKGYSESVVLEVPSTLKVLMSLPEVDLSYTCTEIEHVQKKRSFKSNRLRKTMKLKNQMYAQNSKVTRTLSDDDPAVTEVGKHKYKFVKHGVNSEFLFMILDPNMENFLPYYFKNEHFLDCLSKLDQKIKTHALRSCFSLPKLKPNAKSKVLKIRDSYVITNGYSKSKFFDGDRIFFKVLDLDDKGLMLQKKNIPKFCGMMLTMFKRDQIMLGADTFVTVGLPYFGAIQLEKAEKIECYLDEDEFEPLYDMPAEDKNSFKIDHVMTMLPLLEDSYKRSGERDKIKFIRTYRFIQEEDPQFIIAIKMLFSKYLKLHNSAEIRRTNGSMISKGSRRTRGTNFSRAHKRSSASSMEFSVSRLDRFPMNQERTRKTRVFDIDEMALFTKVLGTSLAFLKSSVKKSIWLFNREEYDLDDPAVQKMFGTMFHPELREFCSRGGFEILFVLFMVDKKTPKPNQWWGIIQSTEDDELKEHFMRVFMSADDAFAM